MNKPYTRQQLIDDFYNDVPIKYVFFWGHTPKQGELVGNFCFSQWHELPFTVAGITYKTAEHWMMANKALLFEDHKIYDKIITATTPAEAKELGRSVMNFDDQAWNTHRFDIVVQGNIHKFNQHPAFAKYLLDSGDRVLVEASPRDRIWGIGMGQNNDEIHNPDNWRGENLLGFALMGARDFLREHGHFDKMEAPVDIPWVAHPGIHPYEMFWRMGGGEDLMMRFWTWYEQFNQHGQTIFKLTNPVPFAWRETFDLNE